MLHEKSFENEEMTILISAKVFLNKSYRVFFFPEKYIIGC